MVGLLPIAGKACAPRHVAQGKASGKIVEVGAD
jgi:hypothetical protein